MQASNWKIKQTCFTLKNSVSSNNEFRARLFFRKKVFSPSCENPFTLIELLVVIAIIAILAAVLLPSLQSARARGRTSDCVNRLKQFAMTMENYRQDFDDHFHPINKLPNTPSFSSSWGEYFFATYLNGKKHLAQCPDAHAIQTSSVGYYTHYGYNLYIPGGGDNGFYGRIIYIKHPSKLVMYNDAVYSKSENPPKGYYTFDAFRRIHVRHDGGKSTNGAYVDGHVQTNRVTRDPVNADTPNSHPYSSAAIHRRYAI